jgi:hypothetical protein
MTDPGTNPIRTLIRVARRGTRTIARKQLLQAIAAEEQTIPAVLDRAKTDTIVGRTKVTDLFKGLPGYGPAKVTGRGENRTRIRRKHAFVQVTGPVGLRIWSCVGHAFKSDKTPLTRENELWRRIPVQNSLYPVKSQSSREPKVPHVEPEVLRILWAVSALGFPVNCAR